METEPISVRVARARGCEPVKLEDHVIGPDAWSCACETGGRTHGPSGDRTVLARGGNEAWLQPVAWAALLAEMVEGPFQNDEEPIDGADVAIGKHGKLGYWMAANDGLNNQKASRLAYVNRAPTLGEAVALAWLSWRESCVVK